MNSTVSWSCSRSKGLLSVLFFFFWGLLGTAYSQQPNADSLFVTSTDPDDMFESISDLDPNRAAILSAILPGLGQAYNNQYWKIPLVYGGGIILGHYIDYNNRIYHEMRNALIAEGDGDPTTINPYIGRFGQTALIRNRDAFRRNRDMLMIITAAYYMLNIVDAHVSAHLSEFQLNDKLSMNISPTIHTSPLFSHTLGIRVALSFK